MAGDQDKAKMLFELIPDFKALDSSIRSTENNIKKLTKEADEFQQALNGTSDPTAAALLQDKLTKTNDALKKAKASLKSYRDDINKLKKAYSFMNDMGNLKNSYKAIQLLRDYIKDLNKDLAVTKMQASGIASAFEKASLAGAKTALMGTDEGKRASQLDLDLLKQKLKWRADNYEKILKAQEIDLTSKGLSIDAKIARGPYIGNGIKNLGGLVVTENSDAADELSQHIDRIRNKLPLVQTELMANYAAINMLTRGFKSLLNYTVQYDEELHQLQAIAAVSDTSLGKIKDTIESVAVATEFTSLELAKASTVLAQAGLSATQIEGTLPAIAKLATATGTDLATSVDVITSSLNIYNLQTTEAEHLTNALTTAMNESKADIAGFQTAIQYAGNFAAQLGVSFEETAAAISAAAQAGIRSKSMLGTGLRAVLTEFLKPTKKLQDQLATVGLTIEDIDVKARGLSNVLRTLKQSGFGAEQAFKGMERRGAAFLAALINQTDFIDDVRLKMAGSTASIEANETQMEALAKQIKNFQNVIGTAATKGLSPFVSLLSKLLKMTNTLAQSKLSGGLFSVFLAGGISVSTITILEKISNTYKTLTSNLGLITNQKPAIETLGSLWNSLKRLESIKYSLIARGVISLKDAFKALKTVLTGMSLTSLIGVLTALVAVVYQVGDAFGWWTSNLEKTREAFEDQKGRYDEEKQSLSSIRSMTEKLYDSRTKLESQMERDIFTREIISKYPEASAIINNVTLSFEDLVNVMHELENIQLEKVAKEAERLAKAAGRKEIAETKEASKGFFQNYDILDEDTGEKVRTAYGAENFLNAYDIIRKRLPEGNFSPKFEEFISDALAGQKGFFSDRGWRSDLRNISQAEAEQLRTQFNDYIKDQMAKGKNLTVVLSELTTVASDLKAQGTSDAESFADIVDKVINKWQGTNDSVNAKLDVIGNNLYKNTDNLGEAYNNQVKLLKDSEDSLNLFNEKVKLGTQSLDDLKDKYEELQNSIAEEQIIDERSGDIKSYKDYTFEDLSKALRMDTEATKDAYHKMDDELKALGVGDEERHARIVQELLDSRTLDIDRNRKLRDIEVAIREKTSEGEGFLEGRTTAGILSAQENFLGKSKNFNKKNAAESTKITRDYSQKAFNSAISDVNKGLTGTSISVYNTEGKLRSSEDILSEYEQAYKAKGYTDTMALEKDKRLLRDVYSKIEDSEDALQERLGVIGGSGGGSGRGNGGYKFDPEAARFRKFYSDINVNTKNAAAEYQKAESPLDLELAKWKGNVSAAERMYGASSGVAEAESIRMRNVEKAQLPQRQENLVAYQKTIEKQLDALKESGDFTDYEKYKSLETQYNAALDRGDYKAAGALDKQMKSLEKTYQKVASTTESLTKKNEELKEKIEENNRILEKENEERTPWGELSSGFGDAATKYVDANQRQGLDTFRGSMEFLSTKAIDSFDSSMTTMFQNIADGSMKAGEAFKEFGRSVIKTIRDVAIQMAVKQGISALFSYFGGDEDMGGTKTGNVPIPTAKPRAQGGIVVGPVKNRDSVDMKLMPGEYVLKKSAVDTIGKDYLDSLNYNAAATLSNSAEAINSSRDNSTNKDSTGVGGVVNVYVVGQEQQQQMTPNDVVVTITQDMLTGGQTKRLVKQIAMGSL